MFVGLSAVPAVIHWFMMAWCPESPFWLYLCPESPFWLYLFKKDKEAARHCKYFLLIACRQILRHESHCLLTTQIILPYFVYILGPEKIQYMRCTELSISGFIQEPNCRTNHMPQWLSIRKVVVINKLRLLPCTPLELLPFRQS